MIGNIIVFTENDKGESVNRRAKVLDKYRAPTGADFYLCHDWAEDKIRHVAPSAIVAVVEGKISQTEF